MPPSLTSGVSVFICLHVLAFFLFGDRIKSLWDFLWAFLILAGCLTLSALIGWLGAFLYFTATHFQ